MITEFLIKTRAGVWFRARKFSSIPRIAVHAELQQCRWRPLLQYAGQISIYREAFRDAANAANVVAAVPASVEKPAQAPFRQD